ncbi:RNA polymerase sigma factor [Novosphingobium sp. Rr 2-17]|uniref:RNA polymerase sigma factor n=1 Tax=Novosphingobium sp. Rr 2-17 TaxID=555793 RepID=UPI001ED94FE5|nr:sigma-70 family RNA polymerase sigma factor [Novosphingobium sp. Rr 2-17]
MNRQQGVGLDRLYRHHRDKLVRFIGRHIQADRAPDIVQQLFARLAAKGHHADLAIVAPDAYLRQAALNIIRDEARHDSRRSANLHVCADDVPLLASDPIAALEARDILARLEATVARLEPRTREIFLAHRIDGFSYGEIAARTGLSVKTVEKHMSLAIAYVARHLAV